MYVGRRGAYHKGREKGISSSVNSFGLKREKTGGTQPTTFLPALRKRERGKYSVKSNYVLSKGQCRDVRRGPPVVVDARGRYSSKQPGC